MSRRHLGTIVLLTGANGIAALSSSGVAVLATLALGPADRGVMVLVLTVAGVVMLVGRLGCGTAMRAQLPQAASRHRRDELLSAYCWMTVVAAVCTGAAAAAAVRLSAPLLGPALTDVRLLAAVALGGAANIALDQLTDLRFADGDFRRGAVWNIAATTAGLIGIAIAVAVSAQVWLLLMCQATALLAVAVTQWTLVRGQGLARFAPARRRDVTGLIRMGAPSLGFSLGTSFLQRADRYLLGVLVGPGAVGIYALAATLSSVVGLLPAAIGQLSQRQAAQRDGDPWPVRAIGYTLLATLVSGAVVAAGGWLLVVPVFGAEFGSARPLIVPLLLAELCLAPFGIASRALLGTGGTKQAAGVGLLAAVASVACYGLAISRWGTMGAATASIALYALLSVVVLVVLRVRLNRRARLAAPLTAPAPPAELVPDAR
ncbi:lipopolysaccharide biosynthesis protein [Micromonospora aurantiaca (nom. illeg.)]|uniref:lipopolysaccharide biosynthesis protein n=1 Tax=Micromonospora aurantiaca (nom. illeg.) TaxID=47850 RepID=UPI0033D9EB69